MALATLNRRPAPHEAVIVFDIGGTRFRAGVYREGALTDVRSRPAISFRSAPELDGEGLRGALLDYLAETAEELAARHGASLASLSLGAAMNGLTGEVYGSGPLWGEYSQRFDPRAALAERAPSLRWTVLNDVSAALLAYADSLPQSQARKVMLVTVSTGIACRVLDMRSRSIPLDEFGLQGEVGHLPVQLNYQGRPVELACDCGGAGHLAAYSSGRGIAALTAWLRGEEDGMWQESDYRRLRKQGLSEEEAFAGAVEQRDTFAMLLLRLATRPMAAWLRCALTLDPELDRIALAGGVCAGLGEHYREALLGHLREQGVYLSSGFDPDYFSRRIHLAQPGQTSGLLGAGLHGLRPEAQHAA